MDIQAALKEGKPRSLGRANEVADNVLANPSKLPELFESIFDQDEIVRMRAGDALEKVCRRQPDWLITYADRLLSEVPAIDQPSLQWHLAQMIGELSLSPKQQQRAINILKNNLETATDWIILNYTLEAFAQFARNDDGLREYFIFQLQRHTKNPHKSVAKRAGKLLASL